MFHYLFNPPLIMLIKILNGNFIFTRYELYHTLFEQFYIKQEIEILKELIYLISNIKRFTLSDFSQKHDASHLSRRMITCTKYQILPSLSFNCQDSSTIWHLNNRIVILMKMVINGPIIPGKDNDRILDICAPELHIMQGTVKHICDKMFKEWPGVKVWLDLINIKQNNYHKVLFLGVTE